MTNDYEHLLISLAFIIWRGNWGLSAPPRCREWDKIEKADGELSLSVGG